MNDYADSYHSQPAVREQTWVEAYYGLFGRNLDQEQVEAIEGAVKYAFRNSPLKPWEMTKAIRSLAIQTGGARKFAPTGEEIIQAIIANRREYARRAADDSQKVNGYGPHMLIPEYPPFDSATGTEKPRVIEPAAVWQEKLRKATPFDRWDIICSAHYLEHVEQRMRFCSENGLQYVDRSEEMRQKCLETIKGFCKIAPTEPISGELTPTHTTKN